MTVCGPKLQTSKSWQPSATGTSGEREGQQRRHLIFFFHPIFHDHRVAQSIAGGKNNDRKAKTFTEMKYK